MDYQEEFEQTPIVKIKLSDTEPYSKHPFKVEDNKKIEMLAEDIKENGLLNPILVRVIGFGGKYEILSGHRRMEALKFNGESEADVRIIKCTDTEAANIVIKSNLLQRDKILPSERAKMYVLRNEYLKKDKYGSLSTGWTKVDEYTQNILAKEFDVSKSSIYEYIRLNNLIDDLLVLVDSGKIKIKIAVSISYFPSGSQDVIYQYFFKDKKAVLNNEYIKQMKKYKHNITNDILEQITTALKKSKNTEKRYVDTFIKKYVRHFKSEQELIERIEILMVDYLERKDN